MDSSKRREQERQLEEQMMNAAHGELDEQKMFAESPVDFAKRRLDEALTDAVEAMVQIVHMSEDDKLRYAAAKYILDRAFGSTSPSTGRHREAEADPLYDFLGKVANSIEK